MKSLLHLILFVFFSSMAFGQNDTIILGFNAESFNDKVLLSWEVKQGNTCVGIDVFRSEDSVNFVKIGDIVGVCGSSQETIGYTFTDPFPVLNKKIFYRINLGGIGFSRIVEIEIYAFNEKKYLLYPNPITNQSQIRFSNETSDIRTLTIYNLKGKVIETLSTKKDFFLLSTLILPSATYRFAIQSSQEGNEITGRFVVP